MKVLEDWLIKSVKSKYIPSIHSHHPDLLYFSLSLFLFFSVLGQTACGLPEALRLQLPPIPAFSSSFTTSSLSSQTLSLPTPIPHTPFFLFCRFFLLFSLKTFIQSHALRSRTPKSNPSSSPSSPPFGGPQCSPHNRGLLILFFFTHLSLRTPDLVFIRPHG